MGFIGLVFAGFFVFILGVVGLTGAVLLIIGLITNHIDKKRSVQNVAQSAAQSVQVVSYKRKKYPKVLIILGILILVPVVLIVGKVSLDLAHNEQHEHEDFFLTLTEKYYDDSERLLKSGNISVECAPGSGTDHSVPAADGEETVLIHFCRRGSPDYNGYVDTVEFLLDHGADMERRMWKHKKNLSVHGNGSKTESFTAGDRCGQNALMAACGAGNYGTVKLLVERGADVNDKDFCGMTPLMYAADSFSGQQAADIALFLAESGADLNVRDNFGQTVWDHIKYYGADQVYEALKNYR